MLQGAMLVFVAAFAATDDIHQSANWYRGHRSTMCQAEVEGMKTCVGSSEYKDGQCCRANGGSEECCSIEGCNGAASKTCEVVDMRAAVTESLSPSGASSSMRATLLFNGMRAWKDVPNAQISKIPAALEWRRALVPSVRTKKGYEVELDCVRGGAGDMCDHFVFMYSCPPCEFADGGNLVATLLADGFMPYRCHTVFDLDKTVDSALHNVVIYHKQTPAGQYDTITANDLLEFAWYSLSPASSFCPAYDDEMACNGNNECSWKGDSCQSNWCPTTPKPHKPRGPWQPAAQCQVCPSSPSEARYLPELLI